MASKHGISFIVPLVETLTNNRGTEVIAPFADHSSLRTTALALVTEASAEPGFLSRPRFSRLIWAWVRLGNEATVKAWLVPTVLDDESVLRLAEIVPSKGSVIGGGTYYHFERQAWQKLIDIDAFLKRLEDVKTVKAGDAAADAIFERFEGAMAYKDDA
jgi:hypothetical protein